MAAENVSDGLNEATGSTIGDNCTICSGNVLPFKKLLDEGNDFYVDDKFEDARECYQKSLQLNPPKDFQLSLMANVASTYFREGNHSSAMEQVSKALEIEADNYKALNLKFRIFDAMEQYEEALEVATYMCAMNPRDTECNRLLEIALMKTGKKQVNAILEKRVIRPISKNQVDMYFRTFRSDPVAKWYSNSISDEDSIEMLTKAWKDTLKMADSTTTSGFLDGIRELLDHKFDQVIPNCDEELKKGEESFFYYDTLLLRGTFRFLANWSKDFILEDLEQIICEGSKAKPLYQATAFIRKGEVHNLFGEFEEMHKAFKKAQEITPNNPDAYLVYCNCIAETDDSSVEAFKQVEKALRLDPEFLYAQCAKYLLEFRSAFVQEPESEELPLVPVTMLANLQGLVAKYPTKAETHIALANFYRDVREAFASYWHFSRAYEIEPDNTVCAVNMLMALLKITGDFGSCLQKLDAFLKEEPYNTSIYQVYASVYLEQEKFDEAIEAAQQGLIYANDRHNYEDLLYIKLTAETHKKIKEMYSKRLDEYVAAHNDEVRRLLERKKCPVEGSSENEPKVEPDSSVEGQTPTPAN